jgi:HEAT repeat protein
LKRIREKRGKVLAGKLLRDIRRIIRTLDATVNRSDRDAVSQRIVTSLDDGDVEVLRWVLVQDISGPCAGALSARIAERAQRPEDFVSPPDQPQPSTVEAAAFRPTGRVPDTPQEGESVSKEEEPTPVEPKENERRLAHFKAGFSAILNGKREPFHDRHIMKALPGAVKKLYAKEKFGTAKQLIERLAAALSCKDAGIRAAVSDALSLSLEAVPAERRVYTAREVANRLVGWIKSETAVTPAYERTCVQLERLARMLLGQCEYEECAPILEAFALTRSGKLQTDTTQNALAGRVLEKIATPDILELLVKNLQETAEAKSEHAGRCLSMLGADVVDRLLDVLRESQDRSEQARVMQIVAEIGRLPGSALNDRIRQGGPSHFMCNLAVLARRVGSEHHVGALQQLLRHENTKVREEALNSICHIGGERSAKVLLEQLSNADDPFKIKVVAVLGAKKYQAAVHPLLDLLQSRPALLSDERDALEERICVALGQIGSEEAIPALSSIVGQKKFWAVKPYHKKVQAAANKAIEEIIARQYA